MQTATTPRKPRLAAIEYIRGISMMGVIGIHIGSQYIMNPAANIHLVALFETFTRFSVPIFFFISAFGLFYNLDLHAPFDFGKFTQRRLKTVLIPYLAWSLLYLFHDGLLYGVGFPDPMHLLSILFFGNAKYQLYFMVILLWFYLLMPLWIKLVRHLTIPRLCMMLALQIAFDYWSSFSTSFNLYVYSLPDDDILKPFLMYRLNYWVLHYFFIFLLGGYLASHTAQFMDFMKKHLHGLTACFFFTLGGLMTYYYEKIFLSGYTALEAINTAHQLCPWGILYTVAASFFFFAIFTYQKYPAVLSPLLHLLGKHSYFAYLSHPLFITYIGLWLQNTGHLITAPVAISFYAATLIFSIAAAVICRKIGEHIPILNKITIGVYPSK
ncbi:Surface polysaccharide O-acyltransferase, integral membrane enzyme [Selenomonas ruminantium]|uniref:Surface polysaccharide O-acyltransferase, integral membrane enzyme n=1 Tax=Selenomonas ruminantium TaxID=971 RepID=A0A1M6U8V4_SELRU|nr:acyltransferase [Selenomonas ruminantium]SHK65682.1 Surface polysaccharide O-acyltransferase, integral membrane enzyme [Selenomonas ruminantium]